MNSVIKRFLAATLALALCAGLAGCTDNGSNGNEAAETTVVQAEYTAAPARSLTDVTFNYGSGFYAEDITLEMNCATDGVKIYYTVDGSVPDDTDNLYTGAITLTNKTNSPNTISKQTGISAGSDYVPKGKVMKANVIRAVAYLPDGTKGDSNHRLYTTIMYDLFTVDGSTYPNVTTQNGKGLTVNIVGGKGIISWMCNTHSDFDGTPSTSNSVPGMIDFMLIPIRNIIFRIANIIQRILGFV